MQKTILKDLVENVGLLTVKTGNGASGKELVDGSIDELVEKQRKGDFVEIVDECRIFDGKWMRDESYPLYPPGSCSYIDESFNCFVNGRRDRGYEKYRWQPNGCILPRNYVEDKSSVFEVSSRKELGKEGSHSIVFKFKNGKQLGELDQR
ncbi:hypothetical protein V6N13_059592 [Hibiscus sabdariffa]